MSNKILLVGRAGMGKTTIKNIIFEGQKPGDLMIHPLEPTRGINSSVYSWLDLELSIFDTSGQELPFLLEDEDEQIRAFDKADAVIYIFDYPIWASKSQEITEEIEKIYDILKKNEDKSNLYLFFHKIDLINQKLKGNYEILKNQMHSISELSQNFIIFFTSIQPRLIFSIYLAFSDILSFFSPEAIRLKKVIDLIINDIPKTICFITNQDNHTIIQSMTPDFDTDLIFSLHQTIAQIDHSAKELSDIYNEFHFIDSGTTILSMLIENIEFINPNFKNIFCLSETHQRDKLSKLMSNLEREFST